VIAGVSKIVALEPQPANFEIATVHSFQTVITVGGGARRRFGHFTFSPARNQALLMLTISVDR
jgi:hypothetical protein